MDILSFKICVQNHRFNSALQCFLINKYLEGIRHDLIVNGSRYGFSHTCKSHIGYVTGPTLVETYKYTDYFSVYTLNQN